MLHSFSFYDLSFTSIPLSPLFIHYPVDARKYDFPIVYASPTFEKLTAYSSNEIIGRNCRFLQAPDGHVALGSRRKYTDNSAVYHIKTHMLQGKECQASIINYRKGGQVSKFFFLALQAHEWTDLKIKKKEHAVHRLIEFLIIDHPCSLSSI